MTTPSLLLAARLGLRLGDTLAVSTPDTVMGPLPFVIDRPAHRASQPGARQGGRRREVGTALIDYLRAGPTPVEHRHLHQPTPPFEPIQ